MKILVTGGAGFIGSHIAEAYLDAGHDVVLLDDLSTGSRDNCPDGARLVECDVRDVDRVRALFTEERFDAVNHHAAQLDVRVSVADPADDANRNIIGSLVLLQAAADTNVERFLFASSGGTVYGDQQVFPADESHPTEPISPYGVAKLSVEKYLGYFTHQYGMRTGALRYTNVYGPRQSFHGEAGVVAIFCTRMLEGRQPVINGSGEQTRDYVYVDDVVRANVAVLEHLGDHDRIAVNICTAVEKTVNDLFRRLNDLAGNRYEEIHGPAKPGEQFRSVCSWDLARRTLGWEPRITFDEGLERTYRYFQA